MDLRCLWLPLNFNRSSPYVKLILSARLIIPNYLIRLSQRRSTTVSLETYPFTLLFLDDAVVLRLVHMIPGSSCLKGATLVRIQDSFLNIVTHFLKAIAAKVTAKIFVGLLPNTPYDMKKDSKIDVWKLFAKLQNYDWKLALTLGQLNCLLNDQAQIERLCLCHSLWLTYLLFPTHLSTSW